LEGQLQGRGAREVVDELFVDDIQAQSILRPDRLLDPDELFVEDVPDLIKRTGLNWT
jgi:hypothetical protein